MYIYTNITYYVIHVCACSVDTIPPIVFNNPRTPFPQRAAADWFTRAGQAKVVQSFGTLRKRECLAARSMCFFFRSMCDNTPVLVTIYIILYSDIYILAVK